MSLIVQIIGHSRIVSSLKPTMLPKNSGFERKKLYLLRPAREVLRARILEL